MDLYIDDGVNVDASWVNSIAISKDGVNWDTINKSSLDVRSRFINISDADSIPFVNKGNHGRIALSRNGEDDAVIDFDPNDVVNQPTWQGNTPSSLQNAVADISGWL